MSRIPKADFMKLSKAGKAAITKMVKGQGAYKAKTSKKRIRGRGDYVPDKYSNKDLAQTIGGRAMGYIWDKLFGNGDYAPMNFGVKNNSFMNEIVANGPPKVWSTNQNAFVMRHSEYLGDITTSSVARDFDLASYDINAGLTTMFPWLSTIASNFQQYKVKGMLFEYRSTCSDAIASSTDLSLGTVILATNYNSAESAFASKQQMLQTEFCSQGKPSQCILHPIECKPSLTSVETLYVRTGDVPDGQDQRLYDLGKFQIATQGFQGTSINIGELWVTYEIELLKPILSNGSSILLGDFWSANSGITVNYPMSSLPRLLKGSNAGTTISGKDIYLNLANPGDVYLVCYHVTGGATGTVTGPVVTATSAELLAFWEDQSQEGAAAPTTGVSTSTKAMFCVLMKVNATFTATPSLNLSYTSFVGSPAYSELFVCKVNPNLQYTTFT